MEISAPCYERSWRDERWTYQPIGISCMQCLFRFGILADTRTRRKASPEAQRWVSKSQDFPKIAGILCRKWCELRRNDCRSYLAPFRSGSRSPVLRLPSQGGHFLWNSAWSRAHFARSPNHAEYRIETEEIHRKNSDHQGYTDREIESYRSSICKSPTPNLSATPFSV